MESGGGVLLDESRTGPTRAASSRDPEEVAAGGAVAGTVRILDREAAGDARSRGERSGQGGAGQRLARARGADERRPGAAGQGKTDVVDKGATSDGHAQVSENDFHVHQPMRADDMSSNSSRAVHITIDRVGHRAAACVTPRSTCRRPSSSEIGRPPHADKARPLQHASWQFG